MEIWSGEQINDFVRKLGFLDTEKEGGDKIKNFLHINEVCSLIKEIVAIYKDLNLEFVTLLPRVCCKKIKL